MRGQTAAPLTPEEHSPNQKIRKKEANLLLALVTQSRAHEQHLANSRCCSRLPTLMATETARSKRRKMKAQKGQVRKGRCHTNH